MGDIYTIHNLEYEYLRGDTITLTSLNGKTNVTIPSEVTIEYPFMSGTYKTVRVNNIGINVGNNMYDNKTVTITFERDMSTYIFNSYNQDDDTSTAFGNNQGANFTINTNTTKERFESLFGPVENFDENKTLSQRSFMFYPMNQNTTFNFTPHKTTLSLKPGLYETLPLNSSLSISSRVPQVSRILVMYKRYRNHNSL